jgi:xanthine dehydrogenase accessory factor
MRALRARIGYVGLVASRLRGPAVLDALDVDDDLRKQVHTPAGFDIGARTPAEVALSILAEIVSTQHESAHDAEPVVREPANEVTSRDPVCGMTVAAVETSPHVDGLDGPVYFCGTGCRTAYLDDPAAYPL